MILSLFILFLNGLQVSCKSSILLSQTAHEISRQLLYSAKRDIEPSLRWAAVQIEALVPVDLVNDDDSVPVRDSWTLTPDESIIDGVIPEALSSSDNNVRIHIIKSLGTLGRLVIKSLKPGISQAVIHCNICS